MALPIEIGKDQWTTPLTEYGYQFLPRIMLDCKQETARLFGNDAGERTVRAIQWHRRQEQRRRSMPQKKKCKDMER